MKKYYVVSAVGRDRPGLVNHVTHAIHELGGNVEMQRSTRMAAEFALLILFSVDEGPAEPVIERLSALRRDDFFVTAREALAESGQRPAKAREMELIASGADQPGVIDAVTLLLLESGVNIETMDFDVEGAPMSGDPLFRMSARLAAPSEFDLATLREKLRDLEDDYNFDIILR